MKKTLLFLMIILLISGLTYGQLSGIKNIPGDYSSIANAIAAMNSAGVGSGGVTFNVAAGYTETFSSPTAGYITTNTGTSANPIIFQKSGTGADPLITAGTGTGTMDAIIEFVGASYITFNGIDLQDNSANLTTTTQMEWGYALVKASGTQGSQYIVIKNCNISLTRTNTASVGIYSRNHTSTSTTALTVTSASGTNSYNKFYSNTIINCYSGIYVYGYSDVLPYAFYDQGNEIGKDGGNNISNYAGGTSTAYGIYTIWQNNLKVANNTISGTIPSSTGGVYGIYTGAGLNSNLDDYQNTVTITNNGTGTFYGIYSAMGGTGTSNTLNFYNNTVTNCSLPNLTTGTIYLMYVAGGFVNVNFYNNNVTGNLFGSATATCTGAIYGMYMSVQADNQGTGSQNFYNNSISNNTRTQSVVGGGVNYLIQIFGGGNVLNLYGNTVSNNTVGSNGVTYGMYNIWSGTVKNVYNNTITGINNSNGTVYGLYNGNGTYGYYYNNRIQNITSNAAASLVYGIYQSSGIYMYFYNNYIAELKAPLATNANAVSGIYLLGGTTLGCYNNTVYLNASSSGTTFGTSGVYASTAVSVDLRNNIVVNASNPGSTTGMTAALRYSAVVTSAYLSTSDYNDFYAGSPAANRLIYYDGTNSDQTMASYRSRVSPRDAQSFSENPPFTNVTTSPYDLHLLTTIATQCESGGVTVSAPVNITTDYDAQPRYPNSGYPNNPTYPATAPDVGADEFAGQPNDITPPAIVFTPLSNTGLLTSRTLIAAITDPSGVPVSGIGLPRLYWQINSGSWNTGTAVFLGGGQYSFTLGTGVALGNTVSYYIAAQDNVNPSPNVGSNFSTGASGYTANPPACSTPPTTLYQYTITASISGVFHVGVGKDYTTLTAAVNDLNTKYMSGPVTFILDDATYPSETFPIIIATNTGNSSTNTLTIKPNTGVTPIITGSSTTGILVLMGIDYTTIDGSNSGGTDKSLTWENTNASANTYTIGIFNNGGSDPSTNCTLKNCLVRASSQVANSTYAVILNYAGGGFDNTVITNNTIYSAHYGLQFVGVPGNITHNGQITNNIFGSTLDASAIQYRGIQISYVDNTLISGNEIMGAPAGNANNTQVGLMVMAFSTNTMIRKNKIHDWYYNGSSGYGNFGIYYNAEANTVTEISNNLISNIKSDGDNGALSWNSAAIYFVSGGNCQVYHNSIYLTGATLTTSYSGWSSCIMLEGGITGLDIRNNIFKNSMQASSGSPTDNTYAIYNSGTSSAFSNINFNDYYADGIGGNTGFQGINQPTLSSWKSATGQDANSINVDPVFTGPNDLHTTVSGLSKQGIYIPTIPDDFAGLLRTNPPDIGAYEFSVNPVVVTIAATSVTATAATINSTINAGNATVLSGFDYGLTTAYGSSINGTPATVNGTTVTAVSSGLSGLAPATLYHYRAKGSSGAVTIYGSDLTFTTLPNPPSVITTAATSISSGGATLNGTVNANNGATTVTFEYGLTTAYGSTITAVQSPVNGSIVTIVNAAVPGLLPNTTYHFRVDGTNAGGTSYGNDLIFTTNAILAIVVTSPATNVTSNTAQLNGTVTANYATTAVSFDWGLTTSYGNNVAATPATVNGGNVTPVLANISGLTGNTTYHFRCVGTNAAGTAYGADFIFNSACPVPPAPGPIMGPTSVCQNQNYVAYQIVPVPNATNYNWTVPAGSTIVSGAGTNLISVNFSMTAVSGNLTVTPTNTCSTGPTGTLAVTVNPMPVPTISGPASVCVQSTNNVYATQSGMTGYNWTVSAGGLITAGAGTAAITVNWSTTGTKTITVNYNNANGCTAINPGTYTVTVNSMPTPTITGTTVLCAGSGYYTYSTETGMSAYTWNISSGGTITAGQGTAAITILWNTAGAQTVSVNYANANGCSAASSTVLNVTVNGVPGAAGAINGSTTVCAGAQAVPYSVAAITGAQTYVWTLPSGATIASGAGTNIISVNYANNATSGAITVQGNNLCGSGAASPSLNVTVTSLPDNAGTITGPTSVCQGETGVVYTVPAIANATGYSWTVPTGATITSGTNTNSIHVTFGNGATSGSVSVFGSNACGDGAGSSLSVTVNPIPATPTITANGYVLTSSAATGNQWYHDGNALAGATGQTYTVPSSAPGWYWTVVTDGNCSSDQSNHLYIQGVGIGEHNPGQITIYPVPNNGHFNISISSDQETTYTIQVFNSLGVMVYGDHSITVSGTTVIPVYLGTIASGLYTIVLRNDGNHAIRKILVNR